MRFYFDFISPYAYIGWHLSKRLAEEHALPLEPTPVLFAALLSHHGTLGPAEVPAKRAYVMRDAYRKAKRAKLPIQPPPAHPFNPLTALRTVGATTDPAERGRLIDALYHATWGSGAGIEDDAAIERAASSAGLDGAELLARAHSDEAKRTLRDATDAAIAAGVFGVPTLFVYEEMFWGVDGIELAGDRLSGGAPVPESLIERWRNLPSSAVRRR